MPPILIALAALLAPAAPGEYDPLRASPAEAKPLDLEIRDAKRSRALPIRVYRPAGSAAAAVVLFSHGLGGNRETSAYLGDHWAARGYVAVFLQHPGSDEGVWKETPRAERMAALKRAASATNLLLRAGDVSATLDRLAEWNAAAGHPLAGRLDLGRVGMAGHSFGALTTQMVSGQATLVGKSLTDARIKAAVVMSPSVPARGDAKRAFGGVKLPWLLLTGTKDSAIISGAAAESRLGVYPALPAGGKYQVVLAGAEHSAFGERALPGEVAGRNPNHHKAIRAITTAFWDAYLRGDVAARQWLDGDGPRGVLEKADRWETK